MPKYEGGSIKIASLADQDEILDGFDFKDCEVVGPAVLAILNDVTLVNNHFDGDFEAILWEVPVSRKRVIGAIGIRNCTFMGCRFRRIGLAGPAELIAAFKQGTKLTSPPTGANP